MGGFWLGHVRAAATTGGGPYQNAQSGRVGERQQALIRRQPALLEASSSPTATLCVQQPPSTMPLRAAPQSAWHLNY